ncbi:hypothetical protein BWQ96_01865 [Gracilariopsis chorda]|uniref:Uncharacterized protein n=1 Tax=Gracilariopsis chorda TaxID=448386 RepID=A0A2V3J216_9FLOR|nr:hypothetical protein BWQ96_01865 [Gracilariopsis chorda]|eukprot:PXF48405.1 hypothetical protein BWQ96_01865 [Gracilariopsis chorda]
MADNEQSAIAPEHTDAESVNKAIANLSLRVAQLEKGAATAAVVGDGDGTNLRPVLSEALMNLKTLRTILTTSASELEESLNELALTKAENQKLKYQIKHLKRSLEAEESKNAA